MTPSGIKSATLRLGANCLNQLHAPNTLHKSSCELLCSQFHFGALFAIIRNLYVEKMSFRDSPSMTKPFADFHEIRGRNSLQKLVGNYKFVKTVSVEVVF